jgi:hypothetical protein
MKIKISWTLLIMLIYNYGISQSLNEKQIKELLKNGQWTEVKNNWNGLIFGADSIYYTQVRDTGFRRVDQFHVEQAFYTKIDFAQYEITNNRNSSDSILNSKTGFYLRIKNKGCFGIEYIDRKTGTSK